MKGWFRYNTFTAIWRTTAGVNLPTYQLSSHHYIQMTIIKTTTNIVTNTIAIIVVIIMETDKERH